MMRFHDIVIGRHNYKNFVSQSKRQIQHPVPALLLRFLEASAGDKLGLSRFFQGILFRFISHLRMIKNQRRKYTQYGRDFYSLVVSIFMFHERNYVIKELQITYLNSKVYNPSVFLSNFCKASGNFFAKRVHSKTPAENRTDCTLSDKTLSDKSDETFCR